MHPTNPNESGSFTDCGRSIPPESIPKYVREGVENQDASTLRELAGWAEDLAEYREQRPIEVEDEELVEVGEEGSDGGSGGTQVIKKVPCGKECKGCPHGPYEYRVKREGKTPRLGVYWPCKPMITGSQIGILVMNN